MNECLTLSLKERRMDAKDEIKLELKDIVERSRVESSIEVEGETMAKMKTMPSSKTFVSSN